MWDEFAMLTRDCHIFVDKMINRSSGQWFVSLVVKQRRIIIGDNTAMKFITGNLYSYFSSVDELIIESTAYCMEKVEDDFMEMAPTDPKDVVRFVKEVPYWTAKKTRQKISADVSGIHTSEIYRARQEILRGCQRALYGVC